MTTKKLAAAAVTTALITLIPLGMLNTATGGWGRCRPQRSAGSQPMLGTADGPTQERSGTGQGRANHPQRMVISRERPASRRRRPLQLR